jgi:hypothetical protein
MAKLEQIREIFNSLPLHEDDKGVFYYYAYHPKYGAFGSISRDLGNLLISKYSWTTDKMKEVEYPDLTDCFGSSYILNKRQTDEEDFLLRTNKDFVSAIIEIQHALISKLSMSERYSHRDFKYRIAKVYMESFFPELNEHDGSESIAGHYYYDIDMGRKNEVEDFLQFIGLKKD